MVNNPLRHDEVPAGFHLFILGEPRTSLECSAAKHYSEITTTLQGLFMGTIINILITFGVVIFIIFVVGLMAGKRLNDKQDKQDK